MTSAVFDADVMGQLARKPGFLLARADQIATAIYASDGAAATLAQSELLLALDHLGPVPQIILARAIGIDKSTNGHVLDNLQARGWIERQACAEDRRRALIRMTDSAREVIPSVREGFAALQKELLATVPDDDVERLLDMLYRIGSNPLSPAPAWRVGQDSLDNLFHRSSSFLFRRVLQHLQATFAAAAPAGRTTLRQFALLYVVATRGPITQTAIARLYGLDPSTCAVILRVLNKRQWIQSKRSDQDGRERVYSVTEIGGSALTELRAQAERSENAAMRGESVADRRWLVEQLRHIVAMHSNRLRFPGIVTPIRR